MLSLTGTFNRCLLLETTLGQVNGWSDLAGFCVCSYFFPAGMFKVWLRDVMQPCAAIPQAAMDLSLLYPRQHVLCYSHYWHRWNIMRSYIFWYPGWLAQKAKMKAVLLLSPAQHFSALPAPAPRESTHCQGCPDLGATTCRSAWPRKAEQK